ncbi:hypothetical protein BC829DRAFT_386203 [Chytridium lagenaria]|nr:hypothetical protein BC829DRAFT_386203 [Chytridium lagenaria]
MGGGSHYPYPKWVWSYYGGWWATPKNVVTNSIITLGGVMTLAGVIWSASAEREEFHDPAFKAQWEAQLKKEGRTLIEPIPESMRSWWPLYNKKE